MAQYRKIIYTLTPEQEQAIQRSLHCRLWQIDQALENEFEVLLADIVSRGAKALETEAMVERGELEVGRSDGR